MALEQTIGEVYISLGSNMGNREKYLIDAIYLLHQPPRIQIISCSSIYETEPVGYIEQDCFLNMVIKLYTHLSPLELFKEMVIVEEKLGRVRERRWGPRTIDLDLLLYNDTRLDIPDLIVPHPRMHERGFVLIPLVEIMDHEVDQQKTWIHTSLEKLHERDEVKKWKSNNWHKESGRFVN